MQEDRPTFVNGEHVDKSNKSADVKKAVHDVDKSVERFALACK